MKRILSTTAALATGACLLAAPAFAAPVADAAAAAAEAAPAAFTPTAEMVNKGDVAWMMVSTALVLMMSVPALALFYGGLVRAKNMLSVLMQVLTIVCVAALVWFGWGYSMAFTSTGTPFPALFGGLDKAFLKGVSVTSLAATFSNGVYLPELVFVMFQMTFACITPALIVGGVGIANSVRAWLEGKRGVIAPRAQVRCDIGIAQRAPPPAPADHSGMIRKNRKASREKTPRISAA